MSNNKLAALVAKGAIEATEQHLTQFTDISQAKSCALNLAKELEKLGVIKSVSELTVDTDNREVLALPQELELLNSAIEQNNLQLTKNAIMRITITMNTIINCSQYPVILSRAEQSLLQRSSLF